MGETIDGSEHYGKDAYIDVIKHNNSPTWVPEGYSLHVERIANGTLPGPSSRARQFLAEFTIENNGHSFVPRPSHPVFIAETDPVWSGDNLIFDGRDGTGTEVAYRWTAACNYSRDGVTWSPVLYQDVASTPDAHLWVFSGWADSGTFRMNVRGRAR